MKTREKIRNAILERDGYCCQICGTDDRGLVLHHKIPKKFGGGDGMENLVTLCVTCHRGAELGKFTNGIEARMKSIGRSRDWCFQRLEELQILNQKNLYQSRPYWIKYN